MTQADPASLASHDEQHIREAAYALWLAEGKPDGKADAHWAQAAQQSGVTSDDTQDEAMPTAERIVVRKSTVRTTRKVVRS